MDENQSSMFLNLGLSQQQTTGFPHGHGHGQTSSLLAQGGSDLSLSSLSEMVYNGFEMWWLAGMPMLMMGGFVLVSLLLMAMDLQQWKRLMGLPLFRLVLEKSPLRITRLVRSHQQPQEPLRVPRHLAVIMDGNRRYGREKYGVGLKGHSDGSKTLVNFTEWCMEMGIPMLTAYAFSTENWKRDQVEVDALMNLFEQFMHEIVPQALKKDICIRVLVSDSRQMPSHIAQAIDNIQKSTQHCRSFRLNICVSYGARSEIVGACKKIASQVHDGSLVPDQIDEQVFGKHLLTGGLEDPDLLLRTSGEIRLSNFLLYQLAYAELIFVDKMWPALTRNDLQQAVHEFNRRKRRFGK